MSEIKVLAIDVGNSRIKAGLFDAPPATGLPVCRAAIAIPVDQTNPAAAIERWLTQQSARPATSLLGGVNPPVIAAIREEWTSAWSELNVVERPAPHLLANRTDAPDRVGPDRLFDAVAANRLRRSDQPAIVIDSGTATTINLIDGQGAFLGGSIVAGFGLMAAALHERTSLLPLIDAADLSPPPLALGRNTTDALRSGLYWNLVGGVKELVARLSDVALETSDEPPLVLLTGGASPLLIPHLPASRHEPYLTLQGLILSANLAGRAGA
ncbi:MAG: type III pantothenate kinase [Planctomycetaceae bacterium]